jgi:hypothetical protein
LNRRKRRKQFKKVFGMNPEQYEKWMREHWPEILAAKTKASAEAIRDGLMRLGEEVGAAAVQIGKDLAEWAEEIRTAAGFMETDNLIRDANIMPEGADKNLLKHKEIRVDRYGSAYDFYYDEANDEYFMEILQEGEKRDGENGVDP